jgi:pseudouridine-5'-phosphate glycosidase
VLVSNVKGTGNENLPVLDLGSADISLKENEPPLLLGLTSAELEAIFSSESAFEEVHVATSCTQSRETAPNKSRTTVTSLVQNPAPLTENIPANNVQAQPWWNTRAMNMCPNITNCVVNFNITNN